MPEMRSGYVKVPKGKPLYLNFDHPISLNGERHYLRWHHSVAGDNRVGVEHPINHEFGMWAHPSSTRRKSGRWDADTNWRAAADTISGSVEAQMNAIWETYAAAWTSRFAVTKPLSQKHRSTFLPLQDADPTPFPVKPRGLRRVVPTSSSVQKARAIPRLAKGVSK